MLHVFVHCKQTEIESDRRDDGTGGDDGSANYSKCDALNAPDGSVTKVIVFMVDLCVRALEFCCVLFVMLVLAIFSGC